MIDMFENETRPLTDKEMKLIPFIINGFERYTKDNPIKSHIVVAQLNLFIERTNRCEELPKLTGARLRKIVNYLRRNALLPLIATSRGYYVSNDRAEIQAEIESLKQRAEAILLPAKGLAKFLI